MSTSRFSLRTLAAFVALSTTAFTLPASAQSPAAAGLGASGSGALAEAPTFAALDGDPGFDVVPGEYVVDVRDDASPADIASLAGAFGINLSPNSIWSSSGNIERLTLSARDDRALLERLAKDPRVESIEPNAVLRALFVPNDPLYAEKQWHLKSAGAERAWEYGCGRGVTVAVVDTGVACYDHGAFSRGTDLVGTRCEGGYNFVDDRDEAYDDQGHGTHVAGTIAQTTHNGKGVAGLAHCARLMPVKVLNKNGWGTVADVAEGIRYAADHGAQVINLSLGGNIKSAVLEKAVNHAIAKGVIIVAAAGNSGRSVGWPAAYPGVVAVSATDRNDNLAWFSSRGPQVVLAAPGVAVTQQTVCDGGKNKCELFGTFNGTSMASPHVAGAAALLVGMGVTRADAVVDTLRATARPKGTPEHFGAGILDAGAAVSRAYTYHALGRLLALGLLFGWLVRRIRKAGGTPAFGALGFASALAASVGLFAFAPYLGLRSLAGPLAGALEWGMRPVGEWSILMSSSMHSFLPLANALPTVVLAAVFFGVRRLRPMIGGFALGSAAFLVHMAVVADVATPFGASLLRVWAVVNALVCLWIARIAADAAKR
jgi:serine protease